VAHCGLENEGSFLYTLTITDIATGWTECLPLLSKSSEAVLCALQRARAYFPFPMLGLDTDNGCEFINEPLLTYCEREHITFTRGREGLKNDQCFVEQKNGAIVRQVVGYDRFEGERAYQQQRGVSLPRAPPHPASDSRERLTLLSAAHDLHRKLWL
jgi:hypothetical protein